MTGWRGTPRPRFTRIKVADASAMPYGTNGDIYAPVIMLAEKAADLIPGRTPLDPIRAPFYRHEPVLTG